MKSSVVDESSANPRGRDASVDASDGLDPASRARLESASLGTVRGAAATGAADDADATGVADIPGGADVVDALLPHPTATVAIANARATARRESTYQAPSSTARTVCSIVCNGAKRRTSRARLSSTMQT